MDALTPAQIDQIVGTVVIGIVIAALVIGLLSMLLGFVVEQVWPRVRGGVAAVAAMARAADDFIMSRWLSWNTPQKTPQNPVPRRSDALEQGLGTAPERVPGPAGTVPTPLATAHNVPAWHHQVRLLAALQHEDGTHLLHQDVIVDAVKKRRADVLVVIRSVRGGQSAVAVNQPTTDIAYAPISGRPYNPADYHEDQPELRYVAPRI